MRHVSFALASALVVPIVACVAATPPPAVQAPAAPPAPPAPSASSSADAAPEPVASAAPEPVPTGAPRACGPTQSRTASQRVCLTTSKDDPSLVTIEADPMCISSSFPVTSEGCLVFTSAPNEITVDAAACTDVGRSMSLPDCGHHFPKCAPVRLAPGTYTFVRGAKRTELTLPAAPGTTTCF